MSLQFEGKVAFITGAARGQGRSHAVQVRRGRRRHHRLRSLRTDRTASPTRWSTPEDLNETVNLVEKTGRRIVAEQGDVRDFARFRAAVANIVAELGRLDFVLANASIFPFIGEPASICFRPSSTLSTSCSTESTSPSRRRYRLIETGYGGAIVITSSIAGLTRVARLLHSARATVCLVTSPPSTALSGLMRYYASALAEKNIRVNTVHPTGLATPMVVNDPVEQYFADHPTPFRRWRTYCTSTSSRAATSAMP